MADASTLTTAAPRPTVRRGSDTVGPRSGSRRPATDGSTARPSAPLGKRPIRVPEVVLGVLIVAGCALGAVLWQRSTNTMTTVVVAARGIPRGSVIGVDDLRGARLGGETGALIAGSDAQGLLGHVAVVDIAADAPLSKTLVTDAAALGADEALTSVALQPGEMPPDLAAGDHLRIIVSIVGIGGTSGAVETRMLDEVVMVWAVDPAPDGVTTVVTVRGSLAVSTEIAAASSVRLVRVAGS